MVILKRLFEFCQCKKAVQGFSLGDRPTAGRVALDHKIGVRIPVPQRDFSGFSSPYAIRLDYGLTDLTRDGILDQNVYFRISPQWSGIL